MNGRQGRGKRSVVVGGLPKEQRKELEGMVLSSPFSREGKLSLGIVGGGNWGGFSSERRGKPSGGWGETDNTAEGVYRSFSAYG